MSLLAKLQKNSTIKKADVLETSEFFNNRDNVKTIVDAINVALGGELDGGLSSGLLMIAGPSRHFKTNMALVMVKSYMDKYPDAILLFYDSEFGSPKSYFNSFGIDASRILHCPLTDIEVLKFDIIRQLQELDKKDKVIIFVDSVGNLASKKEVEDALNEKSVADMTRAKQLKSLFRMVTPHLTILDIPMIVVNHTYKEIGMFPKDIVSGGTGGVYSSNAIWIIGRSQEKDGTELSGYTFTINIEKSRSVKEKSKIPITVTFKGGIRKSSALLDWALESGHVIKPKNGWYQRVNMETGELDSKNYRERDTHDIEWWEDIRKCPKFREFVRNKYILSDSDMLSEENFEIPGGEEDDENE